LLKDLVPLFQTAVWPALIAIVLLVNKAQVKRLFGSLVTRIEQGAPIKAGGLEIGVAPLLPPVSKNAPDPRHVDELPHDYYLVHTARRDRSLDKGDREYHRLRLILDAETPEQLDAVAAVVYRLHPTFKDPIRKVTERETSFELRTAAWGEFNMTAEIAFKDGSPKLVVERYINLPG
jgi:hypothetical protein